MSLKKSDDGKYIILKWVGEINRQIAMQGNIEAHSYGKELGINRYLVDLTESKNIDNTFGNYNFAYKDMKEQPEIDRFARIALLVSPGDHSHDFIETVSRNSGFDVTIFTDREAAIFHLYKE